MSEPSPDPEVAAYLRKLEGFADAAYEAEERAAIQAEGSAPEEDQTYADAWHDATHNGQVAHVTEEITTPPEVPAFSFITGDALMEKELPEIRWLVPMLIRRKGVTVLTAPYKRGKSLLGLGLALDLVSKISLPNGDQDWLGEHLTEHGPVLVLSGEGGEEMLQHRIKQMGVTTPLTNLHILADRPLPNLSLEAHLKAVYDYALSVSAVLVVIDPISRFWSLEDENPAPEMTRFFAALRAATEDADVATLVIHHDGKPGASGGPTFGGRGSSVIGNEADVLIDLQPYGETKEDRHKSNVHFLGRWGEPDPCVVQINPDTLRIEYLGDMSHEGTRAQKRRKYDLAILGATLVAAEAKGTAGGWVTRTEIDATGIPGLPVKADQWKPALGYLVNDLDLEREGSGRGAKYRLTTNGYDTARSLND